MSSITNSSNSSYYRLADPSAGAGGNTSNLTQQLLGDLSPNSVGGTSSSTSSSFANDLVDLSPEAQQYLSLGGGTSNSAASSLGSSSSSSSASFVLTAKQDQAIATILAKYKDAPYTQATFDSIQNDLQAAGLDPTTLSEIDQAQSFNPTEVLVDDLNGDYGAADAVTTPNESAKSTNYMQNIISEWKAMEGSNATATAPAADTTSTGSA